MCHRPAIPLLTAIIAGIVSGLYFQGYEIWAYHIILICFVFIFYAIFSKLRSESQSEILHFEDNPLQTRIYVAASNKLFIPLLFLFFATEYVFMQSYVEPVSPSHHVIHFASNDKWLITGIIDERPIKDKGQLKFILDVEKLGSDTHVVGKLRVTVSEHAFVKIESHHQENEILSIFKLSKGDIISFVSRINRIRNFNNPGGFDYERHMAFRKVWASAYVPNDYPIYIQEKNLKKDILKDYRDKISKLIDETGPGDHVGILKALIIGDKTEISQSIRDDFNQAGIAHLLAISGLHIGIIASLGFLFFEWLVSRFNIFLWNGWVEKGAAVLSWFPVIGYGLLAGISASDSTQRAVIMITAFLTAILIGRTNDGFNTLTVAAILILLTDPPSLFSKSFQLSFAGVLSILYGLSKIRNIHTPEENQIIKRCFPFFLVSLFAVFGTLPLILLYYNNITITGLFANFIFIPVIGFVVIPLGLLAVFLYPLSADLASICIHVSAFVLSNTIETVTPSYLEILGFYILGWAVLNLITIPPDTSDTDKNQENENFWIKQNHLKYIIGFIIIAGIADGCYWIYQRFWHDDLRITLMDVGQGSSALIELPEGHCFLLDGGGFSDTSDFDVGERIIAPFLLKKRIKTVDTLMLSHPDGDHLNGLLYIAQNFNVKTVWTNNKRADSVNYRKFMEIIKEKNISHPRFEDIWGLHEDMNGVKLEILYPPKDLFLVPKPELGNEKKECKVYLQKEIESWREKSNNNSLVIKITFESVSFLFPGDIETEAEQELVNTAGDKLKSTVLIAPHHGSKTSSSEIFLDAVKPEYVMISAGWNNQFHFPHQQVMKRYKKQGCRIFRTDENGAITISTNGKSIEVRNEK